MVRRKEKDRMMPRKEASLASLDQWMDGVAEMSPIDREREMELISRAQQGDEEAMSEILRAHGRFVYQVARKFRGRGLELGDLVAEANIGLMNAVRKFDLAQPVRLLSYARWWMRQAILDAIAYQGKNVAGTASQSKEIRRLLTARDEIERETGRFATDEEVAARAGLTPARVADLAPLITREVRMFAAAPGAEEGVPLHDRLVNEDALTPSDEAEVSEMHASLERALRGLKNERDREILRMLFGLDTGEERTLEEVGEVFGITRERVRQIRERAFKVLREDAHLQEVWGWEKGGGEAAAA